MPTNLIFKSLQISEKNNDFSTTNSNFSLVILYFMTLIYFITVKTFKI